MDRSAVVRAVRAAALLPPVVIVTVVTSCTSREGKPARKSTSLISAVPLWPLTETTASWTSSVASSSLSKSPQTMTPPIVACDRSALGRSRRAASRTTGGTCSLSVSCWRLTVAPMATSPLAAMSMRPRPRPWRSTTSQGPVRTLPARVVPPPTATASGRSSRERASSIEAGRKYSRTCFIPKASQPADRSDRAESH